MSSVLGLVEACARCGALEVGEGGCCDEGRARGDTHSSGRVDERDTEGRVSRAGGDALVRGRDVNEGRVDCGARGLATLECALLGPERGRRAGVEALRASIVEQRRGVDEVDVRSALGDAREAVGRDVDAVLGWSGRHSVRALADALECPVELELLGRNARRELADVNSSNNHEERACCAI